MNKKKPSEAFPFRYPSLLQGFTLRADGNRIRLLLLRNRVITKVWVVGTDMPHSH